MLISSRSKPGGRRDPPFTRGVKHWALPSGGSRDSRKPHMPSSSLMLKWFVLGHAGSFWEVSGAFTWGCAVLLGVRCESWICRSCADRKGRGRECCLQGADLTWGLCSAWVHVWPVSPSLQQDVHVTRRHRPTLCRRLRICSQLLCENELW